MLRRKRNEPQKAESQNQSHLPLFEPMDIRYHAKGLQGVCSEKTDFIFIIRQHQYTCILISMNEAVILVTCITNAVVALHSPTTTKQQRRVSPPKNIESFIGSSIRSELMRISLPGTKIHTFKITA
jgi:hypothetical protein